MPIDQKRPTAWRRHSGERMCNSFGAWWKISELRGVTETILLDRIGHFLHRGNRGKAFGVI
jgi:hypothetical protein